MTKKNKATLLNVFLNNAQVGCLKKENSGQISFQYSEDWLDSGFGISYSLPLQESEYKGEVVSRYFDNLLPDNEEIKKLVATKYGAQSVRPFDLLKVIGKDCVGALSFFTEEIEVKDSFDLSFSSVSEADIANKLRGLGKANPLGMDEDDFRISIAGAQEKTAFLQIDGEWKRPHGNTPTTHIFKNSIGAMGSDFNFEDSVDNEWASLQIMQKMGLDVCNAHAELFEDQKVLVVERFDRRWKKYEGKDILLRIPQEDMCQALGYSPYQKYQSEGGPGHLDICKFLMASKREQDRINFFKTMIVFDLLYAVDGHGKNFSIFIEPDGFKLTPFYDVMGGYFLSKRKKMSKEKLRLAMKVGNSGHYAFKRIARRHYAETAKLIGLHKDKFEQVMEELKNLSSGLSFSSNEISEHINATTIEMLLEGIQDRSKILF